MIMFKNFCQTIYALQSKAAVWLSLISNTAKDIKDLIDIKLAL